MKWRTIFIILGATLALASEKFGADVIGIFAFAWYALLPFIDRKHRRVRWATFTILFNGLLGVAFASVHLILHKNWLVAGPHANHVIHSCLQTAGGILLGVTFTLMFSGQLFGSKREDKEISN